MKILDKQEIISALDDRVTAFNNFIESLDKDTFEKTPDGKWSAGQNLDHLILSIKPLLLAYSLPRFLLKILFGKANRSSKNYTELVEKYKDKLNRGGKASRPFVPPPIHFTKKHLLINRYGRYKDRLINKIKIYDEKDLDLYILPHPLLGKITLREMLFFTIHHNEHHLSILKSRI